MRQDDIEAIVEEALLPAKASRNWHASFVHPNEPVA